MEDESGNRFLIVTAVLVVLLFAGIIITGFATGTIKVYKGETQQEKCEHAGGIYIRGFSDSCAFPPKSN